MQPHRALLSCLLALLLLAGCSSSFLGDPREDVEETGEGSEPDDEWNPDLPEEPELDAGLEGEELDGGIEGGIEDDDAGEEPEPEPEPEPVDAGPPAPVDAGPTCPPARTYSLRHLQASMQYSDTVAQRRGAITAAFDTDVHTISWTEIETIEQVRHIQARSGWATYWPSGSPEVRARNAVPVSWQTSVFEFVRGRSWQSSEGMAGVSPSRWVTRVWLRHRPSGRIQSRIAHHSVSGVDGAGRDPVEWRRRMHAQNIETFRMAMMLDTVPVIGSGDFNTTRLRSLLGSSFRYDVPASGGSHGSRLIDWIVRRPHSHLTFRAARFVTLGAADHKGVIARYDYTPPPVCN